MDQVRATVETVLLYGSTARTLAQSLDKKLDEVCSKMLIVVKNVTRQKRITNERLRAGLPRISTTITERRLRFSGHCWRSKNKAVSDLVSWEPMHGKRSVGGQVHIFCSSAGGGHWDLQRLLASSDGRKGWLEKESHGG